MRFSIKSFENNKKLAYINKKNNSIIKIINSKSY